MMGLGESKYFTGALAFGEVANCVWVRAEHVVLLCIAVSTAVENLLMLQY